MLFYYFVRDGTVECLGLSFLLEFEPTRGGLIIQYEWYTNLLFIF
jgi:hypothetical protein